MRFYKIDGCEQRAGHHKGPMCTCRFCSILPDNYMRGEKICSHLKKIIIIEYKIKQKTKKNE